MPGAKGGGEGSGEVDQAMETFDQVQSIEDQARRAQPRKARPQLVPDEENSRITRVFQRHLRAEGATPRSLLEFLLVLLALAGVALALTFWYVFFDDNEPSIASNPGASAPAGPPATRAGASTLDFSGSYYLYVDLTSPQGKGFECVTGTLVLTVEKDGDGLALTIGGLTGAGHLQDNDRFSAALSSGGLTMTLNGRFIDYGDGRHVGLAGAGQEQYKDANTDASCTFEYTTNPSNPPSP